MTFKRDVLDDVTRAVYALSSSHSPINRTLTEVSVAEVAGCEPRTARKYLTQMVGSGLLQTGTLDGGRWYEYVPTVVDLKQRAEGYPGVAARCWATSCDRLECRYVVDPVSGGWHEWYHNGVAITEERASELVSPQ